ncbi:hypothetical protein pb186bvf_001622 [Paramecium bursaria]
MRLAGPGAQLRDNVVPVDQRRVDNKIFETNQKYQEYINYLSGQQPQPDVFKKLVQWKTRQYENVDLVVDAERISPLLKAIIEENNELKQECQKLSTEVSSFAMMLDKLIDENTALFKHMQLKQLEMKNFQELIQINKADELLDHKHQIQSLQEENNLLIRHLEEYRRQNDQDHVDGLQTELQNARLLYEQLDENFAMCRQREEQYVRELYTLKPQYQTLQEKVMELESKLDQKDDQVSVLSNKLILMSNQQDIFIKQYSDKLQTKQIEIDELLLKTNILTRENAHLLQTLDSYEIKQNDLMKEKQKLQHDASNYQMISDELYAKGRDLKTQLDIEKMKKPSNKVESYKPSNYEQELRRLHKDLDDAKLEYLKLDDFMQKQIESQKKQSEQILENMKIRFNTSIKERAEQVSQLERQLEHSLQENEIIRKEVQIKQAEIDDLKNKNTDYISIRKIMDAQQLEIRMLKTQVTDKKQLISEMLDEKEKLNKMLKEEIKSHKLSRDQLEQEVRSLQIQLSNGSKIQEDLQKQLIINDELKLKYSENLSDYKDMQRISKELQTANQQLQLELGVTNNYVTNLKEQLQYVQQMQKRRDQLDQVLQENQLLKAQLNIKPQ